MTCWITCGRIWIFQEVIALIERIIDKSAVDYVILCLNSSITERVSKVYAFRAGDIERQIQKRHLKLYKYLAILWPQIQRGKQVPAQTCTRFNCPKTGSIGLSTAERQSPVYPARGLSTLLAALTSNPLFQNSFEQGFGKCCLFAIPTPHLWRFLLIFSWITLLTSYHWTCCGGVAGKKSPHYIPVAQTPSEFHPSKKFSKVWPFWRLRDS